MDDETRTELMRQLAKEPEVCRCRDIRHLRWTGTCAHGVSTAPCMDCAKCDASADAEVHEGQPT